MELQRTNRLLFALISTEPIVIGCFLCVEKLPLSWFAMSVLFWAVFSFGPVCIGAIISPFGYTEAQLILQIWSHKIHFLTLERFVGNYSPRFLISIPPRWLRAEIQGHSYFPHRERRARSCPAANYVPFLLGASCFWYYPLPFSWPQTNKQQIQTV